MRESSSDVLVNLSDHLSRLVLKEEQKLTVEALSRKICNGRFREIHYLSKLRLCQHGLDCGCWSISPSIFQDQLQSKDFGLKAIAFKKIPQLKDICANKYNVTFASARNKLCRQNSPQDALKWYNNSFPVVLSHPLNYTSGVCVVDFFYSGLWRKIQILAFSKKLGDYSPSLLMFWPGVLVIE